MSMPRTNPCKKCGKNPIVVRVGKSYWQAKYPTDHMFKVSSTPMRTKTEALLAWNANWSNL